MTEEDSTPDRRLITDPQSFELAKLYYSAAKDAADALDSRLFWAVAGVAALSAFAAKELLKIGKSTHLWLLYGGWALLLLAVLALLLGYLVAPSVHLSWARYWLYGDEADKDATTCPRYALTALSTTALICVVLGALSVIVFVVLNVSK